MNPFKIKTWVLNEMNMPFSIRLLLDETKTMDLLSALENVIHQIQAYLQEMDQKYSQFKSNSAVSAFQMGYIQPLIEDSEFQFIYSQTMIAKEITEGLFDPYFSGQFDPTGFVKGWIVEQVYQLYLLPLIKEKKILGAAVNGSGDMQFGVGEGFPFDWTIGIENPKKAGAIIAKYRLDNGAVATSGISKKGPHIISHQRKIEIVQVTIVASYLTEADVWATAGVAASLSQFEQLIKKNELTGILVLKDDSILPFERGKILYAEKSLLFS